MPISQYILNAPEQNRLQLRLRNKWMIRVRWYYLTILTGVVVGSVWLARIEDAPVGTYLTLSTIALAINGILWFATMPLHRPFWYQRSISVAQITLDLALASYVVYLQGGLTSRATVLYGLPILIAGVLLPPLFAYIAASLSSIAYVAALLLARYEGHFPSVSEILVPGAFYTSVFFILAAIVSRSTTINAQSERERSYTELLALLRHQLHHPVGVISAIVEMLEQSESIGHFSAQDRKFLRQIKQENHRMHTMVANLLAAGEQSKASNPSTVNIVELVEESATNCATAARRLKDLDTRYSGEALMIHAHADQLSLAFDNVIENAFRYSQPGTQVTIEIQDSPQWVKVVITDRGEGITPDKQKHLFERFSSFETDNDQSSLVDLYSLGLGLYVSRLIIHGHGGDIDVSSNPHIGTSITIKLKKGH